jgi:hypothetical protein
MIRRYPYPPGGAYGNPPGIGQGSIYFRRPKTGSIRDEIYLAHIKFFWIVIFPAGVKAGDCHESRKQNPGSNKIFHG